MSRFHGQRGEGKLGFVLTLVAFCALVFAAMRYLPVRINAYQFKEALRNEVRFASANPDDRVVTKRLLDQAEELRIPLDPKNLAIKRSKSRVAISARYETIVDFKVAKYNFVFNETFEAPVF